MVQKGTLRLAKNKRSAFTIFEIACACALLCLGLCAFQPLLRLYRVLHLHSAAAQVAAVCQYLAHAARVRGVKTRLILVPPAGYRLEDGHAVRAYDLTGGITWVAEQKSVFVWDESGAKTPGTIRLRNTDGVERGVSLTRAAQGPVRVKSIASEK